MKALIIEDEIVAQQTLARMLAQNFSDITVCGVLDSVDQAIGWLHKADRQPDLIFMDVELADGKCFEIFDRTTITCPVIMTTAYDNYAVRAFEVNSIDYLLKPINLSDLQRAITRCRTRRHSFDLNIDSLRAALTGEAKNYKQRFLLRFNDKIVLVETGNIAYIYSEEGCTYLMTVSGERYLMDSSLDVVYEELDPSHFFRISRSCIVSNSGIGSVAKKLGNRIKLALKPTSEIDSFVSRSKTAEFLVWLERGC